MSSGSLLTSGIGSYDYLVDYALQKIWCNPDQDNQRIVVPARISAPSGVLNRVKIMMRYFTLPENGVRFHIFQVGQLHPLILGMFSQDENGLKEVWLSLEDAINHNSFFADLYNINGVHLPPKDCYYLYTRDNDLVIAVKANARVPINYETDALYLRVYTNAYYNGLDNNAIDTYTQGDSPTSLNAIVDLQQAYNEYAAKPGHCYAYVNGYLVNAINLFTVTPDDTAWFVYDSSIKRIVTFNYSSLPDFVSSLDGVRKFLLHYASQTNDMIDYQDDIDIYVTNADGSVGVFYHRNNPNACRMVTHRDYSIVPSYLDQYGLQLQAQAGATVVPINSLKIQLFIRKSGYNRPLVFENNRILELYKLSDTGVQNALLGIDSTVPQWRADQLEASAYTQIMRSRANDITRSVVQSALGYNATSRLLGFTPTVPYADSNSMKAEVPYGLQTSCMAYEYDSNGYLLGYYYHSQGNIYTCTNANCALIEFISGKGNTTPDVRCGTDNLPVPVTANYRVYRCTLSNGQYQNDWTDITGNGQYKIINNILVWQDASDGLRYLMVRTDASFLCTDLMLTPEDGNLDFTFAENENRDGTLKNWTLPFPYGELDVFLNGRSLIEGLDYFVQFPKVVICNKEYLKIPQNNNTHWVHYRFSGFCQPDMTREQSSDTGFIYQGLLSNNSKFDLRDDKVLRIVVNGSVKTRDNLLFAENHSGVGVTGATNGQPYAIRDIVVPMKNLIDGTTYTYRAAAQAIDKTVSDYLTLKAPKPPITGLNAIQKRYEIFSPFICKLIFALTINEIPAASYSKTLSDNDVLNICKPYEDWLKFDPTQNATGVDSNYVIIHPTNIYNTVGLNIYQYRLVSRAVALYCNGLVNLSPFIELTE